MEAATNSCPVKQVLLKIWAKFFEKNPSSKELIFKQSCKQEACNVTKNEPPIGIFYRLRLALKQLPIVFCHQTISYFLMASTF